MKKTYMWVIAFGLIFIGLFFFMKWPHHLLNLDICGSGFAGLKMISIYYILLASIILALFLLYRSNKNKCPNCNSEIDKNMVICPYCGIEKGREGIGQ